MPGGERWSASMDGWAAPGREQREWLHDDHSVPGYHGQEILCSVHECVTPKTRDGSAISFQQVN